MPLVYLSGSLGGHWPHAAFGQPTYDFRDVINNPDDVSLIIVPGGADVNPALYGHKINRTTSYHDMADNKDLEAIEFALDKKIPIAGICRGGQMLIVKAGGYLYQNVSHHGQNHNVRTADGQEFQVTSCHHQMFGWPLPPKAQLLAWASPKRSMYYELADEEAEAPPFEPECVFLPEINALATQWHPEWMRDEAMAGTRYYKYLVEKYLLPIAAKKFKSLRT